MRNVGPGEEDVTLGRTDHRPVVSDHPADASCMIERMFQVFGYAAMALTAIEISIGVRTAVASWCQGAR